MAKGKARRASPRRTRKGAPVAAIDSPPLTAREALETFEDAWLALTPAERHARSWALRARLPDPAAAHDGKLFPRA